MRENSPERESRLGISGWPLRRKLALALAIPLLLAAAFGGLRVQADLDTSADASASATQITVLQPAIDYVAAVEEGMIAAQSQTGSMMNERDKAVEAIKAAAADLEDQADKSDLTTAQRRQVATILDLSQSLRADDADTVSGGTWVAQGRQTHSGVTQLISSITAEQNSPEPRLELLTRALSGRFALAMQQSIGQSAEVRARGGKFNLFGQIGAESSALDRLVGQEDLQQASLQKLRTDNAARARQIRTGDNDILNPDAFDGYDQIQSGLLDAVSEDLAATADDARNSALLNALLTLAALAAAVLLAMFVSRALLGPIQRVREGALRVARVDLPEAVARIRGGAEPEQIEPIAVTTTEEVGQLARAVDDLHAQAVTLASGEAALRTQVSRMFVTLSRRNTSLINQQLSLIEGLERDEEDPKRLENLFRLDHLASRIRRTADSLLILADAPQHAIGWESITISDTLQAATAGVQDYQRVRINPGPSLHISESAAGDVVHLLTELVDNSLSYSSPTTEVTLDAKETEAGVTITVVDSGLGIPAEQLVTINQALSGGAEVTAETTRRMGLFVVSRLAERHGISVRLASNEGDGITSYVEVPNALLPERVRRDPVSPAARPAAAEEPTVGGEGTESGADKVPDLPQRAAATGGDDDPLGVGPVADHDFEAPTLLPTRERGATLSQLGAAGLSVVGDEPSADTSTVTPLDPQERKRARAASNFRSSRKRTSLTAVTDPETDVREPVEAEAEPVEAEPVEPEFVEPQGASQPVNSTLDAEAHIAALMAKIRPTRGRLPIPEYEEVDHQAILNGTAGGRDGAQPLTAEPFVDGEVHDGDVHGVPAEPAAQAWGDDPLGLSTYTAESTSVAVADVETASEEARHSSWLSSDDSARTWTSTEVEAGWQRAESVAEIHEDTNDQGLPVRQPGARLMPGGVTKPVGAAGRDPEAIRARLSAHKAGVRRGRSASTSMDEL